MSIGILTTYAWYKPAGLGKRLCRAVSSLADVGHTVDWVAISPPEIPHSNVNFHIIQTKEVLANSMPDHKSRYPWLFYMWHASIECLRVARQDHVQVLLAFGYGASFPLILARIVTGKPLVIFLRSNEIQENGIKQVSWFMKTLFRLLESLSVRLSHTIVPITQALANVMADRYNPRLKKKFTILLNDLPAPPPDIVSCRKMTHELAGSPDAFVITSNGPFNERKNFATLISAVARLANKKVHLVLVGDGALMADLKQLARDLNAADRVTFTGWRSDAVEVTAGSDLFVLPSLAEGVSNSLLEALSAGVPCLASDIPEHREILPDDMARFNWRDSAELSSKLAHVIENPDKMKSLVATCEEAEKRLTFDWNSQVVAICTAVQT